MKTLYYDFETTGMPDFGAPSEAEHQPHIVQVGALLVDENRKVQASIDLIIKPDGWVIPDDAAAIHGVTTERALAVGIDERLAISMLHGLWRTSDLRVGHNESFDARMMRIGLKRYRFGDGDQIADEWRAAPAKCTMRLSTSICQIPSGRGNSFKWPKLTEAHRVLVGEDFEDAHSAMADAMACMRVYQALVERGAA